MINLRDPNEDLFSESRMSFGSHLEELRKVLVRSLIWVAIGCVVGFWGAEKIVEVLQLPLNKAVVKFKKSMAEEQLEKDLGYVPPEFLPLLKEGLVPDQVSVDPGQLVVALQTVIPNFGEAVNLEPYRFRAGHFKPLQIKNLCSRLSQLEASDPTQAARLEAVWKQLSTDQQSVIKQVADASSSDDEASLQRVMQVFNDLLEIETLYQDESFRGLYEPPAWSISTMLSPAQSLPLAGVKEAIENPETLAEDASGLRRKMNRSLIASLFSDEMNPVQLETVPLKIWRKTNYKPQSLGVTEPFFVWLKAGLLGGLTIAAPFVFYELWSFVAAGLYPHEKKYIHLFLPVSLLLFGAGVLMAFFFVFSPVLEFLFTFNSSLNISPEIRIGEWLSFAMFLPLGFGVAFQLPLVMLFVNRIGLVSVQAYLAKWRIAILVIFVLSMFLTPADPISMLLLAVPLTGLYFLGIGLCVLLPRSENPFGAETATNS